MMAKKKNLILMLMMMAVMLFGTAVQAFAAIPGISSTRYIRTYPLSTGNDTYVYTSASLSTRGTSSPSRAYGAVIYASDEIYVYSINGSSAYVSYPTSSGRKYGYIRTSAIVAGNYSQDAKTSSAKITTYMRPGGSVYGSISKGDLVYAAGRSGSYTQVIYPVGAQYKMGWIATSSYEQYIGGSFNSSMSSQSSTNNQMPDGLYKVVSMIDKRHVWDISNASMDDGGNLQLWEDNGTNAQKFLFTYHNDGYYTIKNVKSNKVIDCAGAASEDGTNIQQYTSNGTDAQKWKVVLSGNSCFTMICKCNGKVIDAAGGIASSGTNLQIYQPNGTVAQKFMLVETTMNQESESQGNAVSDSSGRAEAVSYMNAMATVEWTPRTTFQHWSYGSSNRHIWNAGTTYYGIPYTQKARNTSLEKFQGQMSGRVYVGPAEKNTYMGNDCSSAVSYAYRKVNASFPILSTHGMYPVSGDMKKVGSYHHFNSTSSTYICTQNGKNVMKNSYESLRPGDLLLTNAGAHVMMVTEAGNGYVKVTHQTTYNSSLQSTWRVNEWWSFDSLYDARYIPVTMAAW